MKRSSDRFRAYLYLVLCRRDLNAGALRTFIVAAMDTTSNALSMTFSLLAEHPEVQEKLRKEIMEASSGGLEDVDYDTLVSLPYLDAVCRETLRM